MEKKEARRRIMIFFCQTIDADQDVNRRPFEADGSRISFFSLPCSRRRI
jgi:hypothetical protein